MRFNLFFAALVFSGVAMAQRTNGELEAKFGNGESMIVKYDFDPYKIPKLEVDLNLFGPSFVGAERISFMFQVRPVYRISKKIWVDASLQMPYGKGTDGNQDGMLSYDYKQNITIMSNAQFHYCFASKTKEKKMKFNVTSDKKSSSSYVLYQVELPRTKSNSYFLDGGISYLQSKGLIKVQPTGADTMVDENGFPQAYRLGNYSTTSLSFGVSFQHLLNYQTIARQHKLQKYNHTRFYAYMTYAVSGNYEVTYGDKGTSQIVSSGFEPLKFNKIGWRFGVDKRVTWSKKFGTLFGTEMGRFPTFETSGNAKITKSPQLYWGIKFGFIFNKNQWK